MLQLTKEKNKNDVVLEHLGVAGRGRAGCMERTVLTKIWLTDCALLAY